MSLRFVQFIGNGTNLIGFFKSNASHQKTMLPRMEPGLVIARTISSVVFNT